jgi:tight adherence protein C
MDVLSNLLGFGSATTPTIAFVLIVGAAACLLVFGVSTLVSNATDPVRRRIAEATDVGRESRKHRPVDFTRFIDPVAKYVLPKRDEERESTQRRLVQAGIRSPHALRHFYGIKAALAITLPVVMLMGSRWAPQLSDSTIVFLAILVAFLGVRLPDVVLSKLRQGRIKRLRNGFPDALDLLVVCVESGLGLVPAIERVARELEISHPELARELVLVNAEIRAGVERPAALRNLASRTGVEDIGGLVGLLIQTIRFGTSVAEALRVYSEEFRDKRTQKAEEQAAKIGTKMIFPLVTCFFPSFFIVAVGPAAIRIVEAFQSM